MNEFKGHFHLSLPDCGRMRETESTLAKVGQDIPSVNTLPNTDVWCSESCTGQPARSLSLVGVRGRGNEEGCQKKSALKRLTRAGRLGFNSGSVHALIF